MDGAVTTLAGSTTSAAALSDMYSGGSLGLAFAKLGSAAGIGAVTGKCGSRRKDGLIVSIACIRVPFIDMYLNVVALVNPGSFISGRLLERGATPATLFKVPLLVGRCNPHPQ